MSDFHKAVCDYRFLLERGYPGKASLKLIGDRYRLSKIRRNCLFRGVVDSGTAFSRKRKIVPLKKAEAVAVGVDWYNTLITVESYLKGCTLFIADDGIVRDSAGIHGSYRESRVTEKAVNEIIKHLVNLKPDRLDIFIDSPVSYSGVMGEKIRSKLENAVKGKYSVQLVPSADYPLKRYRGIVASSDSVILDSAAAVIDLPRFILEYCFNYIPPAVENLNLP
ncbi:MAG: DUF434 domain-containing protein [Spirochaetes bacterium]|nr:DUF434 domain-containing protein [Spirochaetota bacterium]